MSATAISRSIQLCACRRPVKALACLLLLVCSIARADTAVEFEATYTADLLSNRSGGLATGTRYLDDLGFSLHLDFGDGPGVNRLYLHGLYNNGASFSRDLVGDLQGVSNLEADRAWRLFEAWYEFGGERWSLRTGLYDLNTEFDMNEAGALFLHSSHGIGADLGQTGRNGPGIFPVSALALRGSVAIASGVFSLAALDAVPGDPADGGSNRVRLDSEEGALLIAQFSRPLGSRMRAWGGYWAYTEHLERPFEPGSMAIDAGWYAGLEGVSDTLGGLAWFLRYGRANPDLNVFGTYAGAGLVLRSPFTSRPNDRLGLAVASAGSGAPYSRSLDATGAVSGTRETAWELTYRTSLGERLILQPDIQYVRHPAARADVDDALVIGLRFELSY